MAIGTIHLITVNNGDGSVDLIISKDSNGDIGVSSEGNEITVFGLGGHQHISSWENNLSEIKSQKENILRLLTGLMNGHIGNAEYFLSDGSAIGGCYEEFTERKVLVNPKLNGVNWIEICIHKDQKYRLNKDGFIDLQ